MKFNIKKISRKAQKTMLGFPETLVCIAIAMLLNAFVSFAKNVNPSSPIFTLIMCGYICLGVWYYQCKNANIVSDFKKCIIKIVVISSLIILAKCFNVWFIIASHYSTDIVLIKDYFNINLLNYNAVSTGTYSVIYNAIAEALHLIGLMGICKIVEKLVKDHGKKAYKAVIYGSIFMALYNITNGASWISVLGFWGVCDFYLHLEQYKSAFTGKVK